MLLSYKYVSGYPCLRQTARDALLFYDVVQPSGQPSIYTYGAGQADLAPSEGALHATFASATGDHFHVPHGAPLSGDVALQLVFRHALQVDPGIACIAAYETHVVLATREPRAIQAVPWPGRGERVAVPPVLLDTLPWLDGSSIVRMEPSHATGLAVWVSEAGHAYVVQHSDAWQGVCVWRGPLPMATAINARFSLVALGLGDGCVALCELALAGASAPTLTISLDMETGPVRCAAWTPDGHALAVGYKRGWALFSTYGHVLFHSFRDDWDTATRVFRDAFMFGARSMFWGPGGMELYMAAEQPDGDTLAYLLPHVKSASTTHMAPDDARAAVLLTDDAVLVYRGHEQSDASLIAPENDAWRHISLPPAYLAAHWPLRYASLSPDGRFLGVAGRRGLAHYSCVSGRWKTHTYSAQEYAFSVRGGLAWFAHVLIAACDCDGEYQVRLYSRDQPLENAHLLELVLLSAPVVTMALFDTSLLLYTADNTLYHYLITPTRDQIRLRPCGSISFRGVVGEPARARAMSWLLPTVQQTLGNPADDLSTASLLFLIDGMLVLLRPVRGAPDEEVSYDLQVLHERIETYWTNLQARGPLHNSLWAYDGRGACVWLDVLAQSEPALTVPLESYPLCVMLDRGIVLGADAAASVRRTLDGASFRMQLQATLFLDRVLRAYLSEGRIDDALDAAAPYVTLEYFAHMLELLVHSVLEDEADAKPPLVPSAQVLPATLRFVDHYDVALRVVANAARKTEMARWPYLFTAAGRPDMLVRHCLARGDLHTASSYLLVAHELEERKTSIALTASVLARMELNCAWNELREALSFLRSLDEDGTMLRLCTDAAARMVGGASVLHGEPVPEFDVVEANAEAGVLRELPVGGRAASRSSDHLARPSNSALAGDSALDDSFDNSFEDMVGSVPSPKPRRRGLEGAPRHPSSLARRLSDVSLRESPMSPTPPPSAHTLHRAARHASLSLSPAAKPIVQANGRIVVGMPSGSPRPP